MNHRGFDLGGASQLQLQQGHRPPRGGLRPPAAGCLQVHPPFIHAPACTHNMHGNSQTETIPWDVYLQGNHSQRNQCSQDKWRCSQECLPSMPTTMHSNVMPPAWGDNTLQGDSAHVQRSPPTSTPTLGHIYSMQLFKYQVLED